VKLERERERERGFELKKGWFEVFASKLSGQPSWGRGEREAFYGPRRNLPIGVSENRTCPVSGARHVQKPSLEPDLGTRHVRSLGLTQVRAEDPDMSDIETG
jgi:hypothetical protein